MNNILLDVDGVLADYTSSALKVINRKLGLKGKHRFDPSHVTQWDICAAVGHSELWNDVHKASSRKGFCLKVKPYDHAVEGVKMLRQHGEVYAVTSPLSAPRWMYERSAWLKQHFEIQKTHVVHTQAKHLVQGLTLIDDKFENVEEWVNANPNGLGLLWDMPYNRSYTWNSERILRVCSWDEVNDHLRKLVST